MDDGTDGWIGHVMKKASGKTTTTSFTICNYCSFGYNQKNPLKKKPQWRQGWRATTHVGGALDPLSHPRGAWDHKSPFLLFA